MILRQLLELTNENAFVVMQIDDDTLVSLYNYEVFEERDLNHYVNYFEATGMNTLYVDITD